MLPPLTHAEYEVLSREQPYCRGRWGYLSVALGFAALRQPATVLEVGANVLPIFHGSETLDVRGSPTILHDAGVAPWPVADKAYDLLVGLQVWEHLRGRQVIAFREAMRVAKAAVLSFPLEWPGKTTHNVTEAMIREWTLGRHPAHRAIVRDIHERVVVAFDFST
jgi:hypothetical protein